MALLSTLIDDFQDGVIDTSKWGVVGTVAETGGRVRLTPTTSYSFLGTVAFTYDLTNSSVVADIPVITANGSTGTLQSGLVLEMDATNQLALRKVGAQLVCTKEVAGVESQLSFTPYDSTNHRFWRIRADASNIYWETSATGIGAFFIQTTISIASLGFAITALGCYFYTGYAGIELFPGTFQIESVNPGLAFSASGASTSTGTLHYEIEITGNIAASGASTSTGSLDITVTRNLTLAGASTSAGGLTLSLLGSGILSLAASGTSTSAGVLVFAVGATLPSLTIRYFFEPPIAYDNPHTLPEPTRPRYLNAYARWKKTGGPRGRSVLKTNGVYTTVDTPTIDQTVAADIYYAGGHIYEVTAAEAADLIAAGFTLTNVVGVSGYLLTEAGDYLTTESGSKLLTEYVNG